MLTVFDHERDIVGAHFESRSRAFQNPQRVVAKTRVEKAGVVGAELSAGGVVRCHFTRQAGRDADRLFRRSKKNRSSSRTTRPPLSIRIVSQ